MLLSFLPLLLSTVLVKTTGLERNGAYFGFHNKQEIQHQNSEIEKSLKIQSHFSQTQGSISVSKKNDDTESSASFTFVEIKLKLSDAINPTDALGLWCEESDELVDFITLDEVHYTLLYTHTFIHSYTHTLIHSYTHTLIYSFILSQTCHTAPLFCLN